MDDTEDNEIFFEGDTIAEIFNKARNELKMPLFYFDNVIKEYEIVEAKYNSRFHTLTIELKVSDGYAYISEMNMFDDEVIGVTMDADKCTEIYNESLHTTIPIYKNKEGGGYIITIKNIQMSFNFSGDISLDECEKIAESLCYK